MCVFFMSNHIANSIFLWVTREVRVNSYQILQKQSIETWGLGNFVHGPVPVDIITVTLNGYGSSSGATANQWTRYAQNFGFARRIVLRGN